MLFDTACSLASREELKEFRRISPHDLYICGLVSQVAKQRETYALSNIDAQLMGAPFVPGSVMVKVSSLHVKNRRISVLDEKERNKMNYDCHIFDAEDNFHEITKILIKKMAGNDFSDCGDSDIFLFSRQLRHVSSHQPANMKFDYIYKRVMKHDRTNFLPEKVMHPSDVVGFYFSHPHPELESCDLLFKIFNYHE